MPLPRIPHGTKTGKYRSKLEARTALQLRGAVLSYEEGRIEYALPHTYLPDFRLKNGVIIECKGWFTSSDRTKHLAIKAAHPDLDLRFCFQNAKAKLSKNSKTTYADWCEKHGFLWCHVVVPADWLK